MAASLTPVSFWILTALADERRHGYDIMREAVAVSGGAVVLKITTLYAALERLERQGLIRPDGEEIVEGRARRYFRVTDRGVDALTAEITALERMALAARAQLARTSPGFRPPRAAGAPVATAVAW